MPIPTNLSTLSTCAFVRCFLKLNEALVENKEVLPDHRDDRNAARPHRLIGGRVQLARHLLYQEMQSCAKGGGGGLCLSARVCGAVGFP